MPGQAIVAAKRNQVSFLKSLLVENQTWVIVFIRRRRRKDLDHNFIEVKQYLDCNDHIYWVWYSYGEKKGFSYRLTDIANQISDYIN